MDIPRAVLGLKRMKWVNLKNEQEYLVTGERVDCTNEKTHLPINHPKRRMVEYEDDDGNKFIRTYEEFLQKFEPLGEAPPI